MNSGWEVCAGLFGVRNSVKVETCNQSYRNDFESGCSHLQAPSILSDMVCCGKRGSDTRGW